MADDMGWGDPYYNSTTVTYANGTPHPDQGWISTPTLDAMAANGLRFDRFYSASAVCSPTRASCLTGRSPIRVGVPNANSGRLGFDETPLSEVLSAAGYRCGHFGKWHLGSLTTLRSDSNRGGNAAVYSGPWHHGYDFCFVTESKVPTYHPYRIANNSASLPTSFTDSNFYGTRYWRMPTTWNESSGEGKAVPVGEINNAVDGDDSKLLVDQVIPFVQDSVSEGEPFFVVLWFHTPHKPMVDPQGSSGIDSSDALRDSIEDMDTALGRLRDELTTLGVRDNTMFWVTSDNGPEDNDDSFNETSTVRSIRSGRRLERKRSLFEGGVRVPGILEWPAAISSGRATGFPAVTSDYYPTILDYLELSVPNQKPLDGVSLRPLIESGSQTRTKPIGFEYAGARSWVNEQYKLIDNGGGWELYDLINIAPGEEIEQTATATATNIGSKSQAVQDIYNTMLAEYAEWTADASADTPYVHSSQPTAALSTPSGSVPGPFAVTATFSEPVSQLNANEFVVTGGSASGLSGGGTTWSVTVSPAINGVVTIDLPEGCAIDADGNPNAAADQLSVTVSNPDAPDVALSTPDDPVVGSFTVTATFTEDVVGLDEADFGVTNGTATNLSGGPAVYTVTIVPEYPGTIALQLPSDAAQTVGGFGSNPSNSLSVTYDPPVDPPVSYGLVEFQTVDVNGDFPADGSNNIDKFDVAGSSSGTVAPFDTTTYVRASASGTTANFPRRAQLLLQFDLAALAANSTIADAQLEFSAYSLNDLTNSGNDPDLFVSQVADDWSPAGGGALDPDYNPAVVGSPVNAGKVTSGTGTDLYTGGGFVPGTYRNSTPYSIDVTDIVRSWQGGAANHGFHLELGNTISHDQGLGIDPATLALKVTVVSKATVLLSTPASPVSGPYTVDVTFSESVAGLEVSDFSITNGAASGLTGASGNYSILVTPEADGEVTVVLPVDSVTTLADGIGNAESNTLITDYVDPVANALLNFRNGDLNLPVGVVGGTGDGAAAFSFDPLSNEVLYNGTGTGRGSNEWIEAGSTRGFTYSPDGGAGGSGDGAFIEDTALSFNQKPRAVFYFVDDDKQSTGLLEFGIDVFFEDNSPANPLQFLIELYGWDDGQAGPALSWGGPNANDPTYNVTALGDAVTILSNPVLASSIAAGTWQTVSLGSADVGSGYDNYAWRIGVLGATDGDTFGFDNLTVSTGAAPEAIRVTSITRAQNGDVTIAFVAESGNVDVYRSPDLMNWGVPIATNVPSGDFSDTTASALVRAFYVLVPAGAAFP
ncbi:hypothetical protein HAHE_42370 [Haloferula helveola]|uniref:Sulfatase n=2 Tax=Haloferula helveola TaxID=490095 RepID=A0ABN6H9Z8_9BACT|nr:hypothetical protein HAHE_42370 [Haloferula helveola]